MQLAEKKIGFGGGHGADIGQGSARDPNNSRFEAQPSAVAIRTERVAAILGKKDADVELIFLGFEKIEKALDAAKAIAPANDGALLIGRQLTERFIGGNARGAGKLQHLFLRPFVLRLGPWFDRTLCKSQLAIWNHQIVIEADGIAESLAGRASAERIVEAEQPRFRRGLAQITALARKPLRIEHSSVRLLRQLDD